MQKWNSLNPTGPIDDDNLNIVIRPRPPRRRQSGISFVPFRPYVKCLTSIREPCSFTDGKDKWKVSGKNEIFFQQQNARCIGSLIDDCDISDVIRWDIEGESTRLPMMCKLWMIVDGAIVERGKPHLVQDAAVQVYTAGRDHRSILAGEQRYNQISFSTSNRRRRHSWHDVNEYHSVPYYQYTRLIKSGFQQGIQCNLDNEQLTSTQQFLSYVIEETVDDNQIHQVEEHKAKETVHNQSILQDRVQVSIMTQTEHQLNDRSTEIDIDFIHLFNHDLQTNENLLSSVVNPYIRHYTSYFSCHTTKTIRNGIEYTNRSVSTGDDYPQWWVQLSTNVILSNRITNQGEEKKKVLSTPSPRQLNQSSQTDTEFNLNIQIDKSPRIQKSSSSLTINDNYEIIDQTNDGNNSRRILPFHQKIDSESHSSDYCRLCQTTRSSKQSESDYNTFQLNLNQQSYSTPQTSHRSNYQEIQTKTYENPSSTMLATLLERYQRTLQERQSATAIVNDQLLDIDDLLQRYRQKIQTPDRAMELHRDISVLSSQAKEENVPSSLSVSRLVKSKYREMPNLTSEEMLKGYIPSPRLYTTNSPRQPLYDYCDLCLIDHDTSSAWIRYNEHRIEQLQKRIDLMLEFDDENQLILSSDPIKQNIDDIIMRKTKYRNQRNSYHNRILLPHRYSFRYPYRLYPSLPNSPRLLTRNLTRSAKSVRISTNHDQTRFHEPLKTISQPIISILRRNNTNLTSRSQRSIEGSHIWKNDSDGKIYILKQFSIPRYYRLYNDASFREVYHFSRILESYSNRTNPQIYSSIIRNFAVEQQLPTITSVA